MRKWASTTTTGFRHWLKAYRTDLGRVTVAMNLTKGVRRIGSAIHIGETISEVAESKTRIATAEELGLQTEEEGDE